MHSNFSLKWKEKITKKDGCKPLACSKNMILIGSGELSSAKYGVFSELKITMILSLF